MNLTSSITAMNFTENQQGNAILDKLRAQRSEGRFCDVVFHIQNTEYKAHRNVLAACSPYFDTVLKIDRTELEHVTVECKDQQVFEVLLDYIYTGSVVVDSLTVEELVRLANRFMISKLKDYCCEYIERNITVDNCFTSKAIAQKCGLSTLVKTIEAFILANIMDVIQKDEILSFTEKNIQTFVSNKTLPLREELKLHIINRWVCHNMEDRQRKFHQLLSVLRWDKISLSIVYTILEKDMLFQTNEWCLYCLLRLLRDRLALNPQYQNRYEDLKQQFLFTNPLTEMLQASVAPTTIETVAQENPPSPQTVSVEKDPLLKQEQAAADSEEESEEESITDSLEQLAGQDTGTGDNYTDNLPGTEAPLDSSAENGYSGLASEAMELGSVEAGTRKKRKRRKGIPQKIGSANPLKLRISKAKLKMETKPPKKRGRPPNLAYKKGGLNKKNGKRPSRSKVLAKPENIDSCESDASLSEPESTFKIDTDNENEQEYNIIKPADKKPKPVRRRKGRKPKRFAKVSCRECQFITSSEEKLEKHRMKAHRDNTVYSCSICGFQSTWNREYYTHMKTHFPGPPFPCDYSCGYSADRIQQLLYHRMSHTDERPYECDVCNLCFRSKNNLTMHARCHTGVKPFKCEHCGRSFATKGTLDQHSVTHSDLRPYLCDLCGFSTKYQSHLIAHKRIHTGDVFRCQYPNCKYCTPKRSQLACHMRSHMSIRSHICSVCGRAFVEKSHLVRHEKIHLDTKPFKCDYCEYGSTRRDKLKDHITKYHGESTSAKAAYRPRKSRRQTYDPHAFPLLSTDQASAEMHTLLEQSDLIRQQEQLQTLQTSDMVLPPPSSTDIQDTFSDTISTQCQSSGISITQTLLTTPVGLATSTGSTIQPGIPDTRVSAALMLSNSASAVQSVMPSLLPVMLGSQQPVMVVPQSSSQMQYSGAGSQLITHSLSSHNQQTAPQQTTADINTMQTLMNLF